LLIAGGVALGSDWIATSWLQAESLPVDVVAQAFVIMGLVAALRFVEGIYRSCIVGLQRQVLFNVITSIMATVRALGAVAILAWVSPSIEAFFIWQGLMSAVTVGILAIASYAMLPGAKRGGRFSLPALRGIWRFAGGMLGITFLATLLSQMDKILLSKLLSLSEYGYYTLAVAVSAAVFILVVPITQALYPRLCELHARGDMGEIVKLYHQGAQFVSVVAGSAAIVLILFAETFLRLWTQDPNLVQRVAPLLSLLMLGNLLNGLMGIPYQTQLAHGWTGLAVRVNIVAVSLIVPAILWVTPRFGAEGAAWVWVSLNALRLIAAAHFMHGRILLGERLQWYMRDVIAPLGAGFAATIGIKLLRPDAEGIVIDITVLTAAICATVVASTLAADHVRTFLLTALVRHRYFLRISGSGA
jgi:O-antigen/teichoic acid export membrane protein